MILSPSSSHALFWPLTALALLWACSRPAAEGAADPGRPVAHSAAPSATRAEPSHQDPCAEAIRKGEASQVNSQGRLVKVRPPRRPPQDPDASITEDPGDGIPSLRLITAAPTSKSQASLGPGGSPPPPRGHAQTRKAPQRIEVQVLLHGEGACLEIFVEDRLRGRLSTRLVHTPGKPATAPTRETLPKGVRELLRWPISNAQTGRSEASTAATDPAAPTDAAARRPATPGALRPQYALLEVDLDRGERRLELRAVGPGTLRLFGLSAHHRRPGVVVHNVGVIGAQAANALPGLPDLPRRQIRRLDPALVVIMLGTNDAYDPQLTAERFASRLRSLIKELKAGDAAPDCLVLGVPDFGDSHWRKARSLRRQARMIRAVGRRVAQAEGCAHWDLFAAMGGAGAMSRFVRAQPPLAYRDQVHLTPRGYRALGQLLFEGLMQRYGAYLKARPRLKVSPPNPLPHQDPEAERQEREKRRRWPTGMGPVPIDDLGGKALTRLFRSLVLLARKAPQAEARVLFVGDSHVAGDQLTGELRRRLQGAFGDAGHGYVHAGHPWPGYFRRGLRINASGPWSYYFLRTRSQANQPTDRVFGLGGVSTWITLPLPPSGADTPPSEH